MWLMVPVASGCSGLCLPWPMAPVACGSRALWLLCLMFPVVHGSSKILLPWPTAPMTYCSCGLRLVWHTGPDPDGSGGLWLVCNAFSFAYGFCGISSPRPPLAFLSYGLPGVVEVIGIMCNITTAAPVRGVVIPCKAACAGSFAWVEGSCTLGLLRPMSPVVFLFSGLWLLWPMSQATDGSYGSCCLCLQ